MIQGKSIVVTGANRGIGRAVTEECAKNGANVWACMRSVGPDAQKWIEELEKTYDVCIWPITFELTDENSIKDAASAILSEKTPIDGIVNNAGVVGEVSLFSMTPMEKIREVFETNFFGPMEFTQRLLKRLIRQKSGSVVYISSVASLDGDPGQFGYVTSKSAVNGAAKKLSLELGQFGIRVNAVAPGMTDTSMISNMSDQLMEETLGRLSLRRLGKPEEIAKLCVYLLSDNSSFITGQLIRIDGGSI